MISEHTNTFRDIIITLIPPSIGTPPGTSPYYPPENISRTLASEHIHTFRNIYIGQYSFLLTYVHLQTYLYSIVFILLEHIFQNNDL
jgi:hypothetical protein